MPRKILIIIIVSLLLLTSLAFSREKSAYEPGRYNKIAPVKRCLFDAGREENSFGAPMKAFLNYSTIQTFAPSYQVYTTEITQRDRQHYTTMGRQIAYGGYYNAGCDYVYMDYTYRGQVGGTEFYFCNFAIFDWNATDWDYGGGGVVHASPNPSNTVNIDVTPVDAWPLVSYHNGADAASPYYSVVGYSPGCTDYSFSTDSLPGVPNVENIQTGYCGDIDNISNPYVWPHIDVDTTGTGLVITHAAATEAAGCAEIPDDAIETMSLVYWRKVATSATQPWSGTWEGPYFMDSAYVIGPLVRADKNSDMVYYCYLKPLYYYTGDKHPCEANGLGHYQITNEVVYKESSNNGASWSAPIKVTDYASGFESKQTDPAVYDLSAMVDPSGALHIIWASGNRDLENECVMYYSSKLWHWDSQNDCISIVYDGTHPVYFRGDVGAWNIPIAKYNISMCDDKMYISFTRFGANPVGDTSLDYGAGDGGDLYQNGEILVTGSDATGGMGKTWTDAINLTQTESDSCLPGDCFSEHWSSMAMYSTSDLMLLYIEDKDPGAYGTNDTSSNLTNNPVMFMTWPCFTMAEAGTNVCASVTPANTVYQEIALAPNGNTSGCTTPATFSDQVELQNCGGIDLNYTTSSDAAWLAVTSGASGSFDAGAGPRYSDNVAWSGKLGCASGAIVEWQANSASLGMGNYQGTITIDIDNPNADDIEIVANVVVACDYYLPEFATITGGCWTIDVWNTPQAANQANNDFLGNMKFYACGDTINPLYHESFVVGWKEGATIHCYGDGISSDSSQLHMRALSDLTVTAVGDPTNGVGYWLSEGYWCTPDSVIEGKIEYIIPGHQDTSVLIERVTLWNTTATTLQNFVAGEDVDWDCDRDSALDEGGIDLPRKMVYQKGQHRDQDVVAGLSPYGGYDASYGAAAINGYDYTYFSLGFYPDTLYNLLTSLDNQFQVFSDSANGTEMHVVNRFKEGSLAPNDTLTFCKLKAVSLTGVEDLGILIDKGKSFIDSYGLCEPPASCQGRCGNANGDASVNVSDAVYIINFVFVGGNGPLPVRACGNANGDVSVNVSDAVYIINFVFVGGNAPGDCHPGVWDTNGGDCCPY